LGGPCEKKKKRREKGEDSVEIAYLGKADM